MTVLDNRYEIFGGIALGGLSSARKAPDTAFLKEMACREEFQLLMCHHPEYYRRYVKPFGLDLTVSTMVGKDENDLPMWAATAMQAMADNGITMEMDTMTRAEAAALLYQISKMK